MKVSSEALTLAVMVRSSDARATGNSALRKAVSAAIELIDAVMSPSALGVSPPGEFAAERKLGERRIERECERARRALGRSLGIAERAEERDRRVSPYRRQVDAKLIADGEPVEAATDVRDQRVEPTFVADDAHHAIGKAQARQRREGAATLAGPAEPSAAPANGERSMSSVTVGLTRMARAGAIPPCISSTSDKSRRAVGAERRLTPYASLSRASTTRRLGHGNNAKVAAWGALQCRRGERRRRR